MNFVNALNAVRLMAWIAIGALIVLRLGSRWIATKVAEESPLMTVVNAANALKSNIWAIVIIGCGVLLSCCGDKGDGQTLIAGGFALFQHQKDAEPSVTQTSPNVPAA